MGVVAWIPGLIGAAVSVGLARSGLLGFLFLLPLGIVAYCYNARTAWFAALVAIPGNVAYPLIIGLFKSYTMREIGVDIFYLVVVSAAFTWITSPPVRGPAFFRISTAYRLIAGSVLVSLAFTLVLYSAREDQGLLSVFREQAAALAALYTASSGADVVQRSLMEQYITADTILETLRSLAFRGGMTASWILLFFVSRQISLVVTWFVRHKRLGASLSSFHVRPECIWALSFSLLAVLAGLSLKVAPLEIVGWNVLVICSILYLAQGGGIVLFFLTRARISARLHLVLNLCLLLVILSPGINVIFLGGLVLLGIAENWAPFRTPKQNGPPPTPGMGE